MSRHPSSPRARTAGLAALAVLAVGPLSACSVLGLGGDPEPADPASTAEALATQLSAGSLQGAVVGATPRAVNAELGEIVAGLGDLQPTVTVTSAEITSDGTQEGEEPRASVTLRWSWPFTAGAWEYETTADLEVSGQARDEDGDGTDDRSWTLVWQPSVVEPSLAEGETLDATTLTPDRGDVVGAGGRTLVTARPVVTFGIDKSQVGLQRALASARTLAGLTDVDAASFVSRVRQAGDQAYVEAITYRLADVPARLGVSYEDVPGVLAVRSTQDLAPTRGFAAEILGSVGDVTAEMVAEDPETYAVGDVAGVSGLQARYDDTLRGTPGLVVEAEPADDGDGEARELFRVAPTDGKPLRLSLDLGLQESAEALLADVGPASALVAIRPSTGAILAAANGPGTGGVNVATYGQAAPGSTFKIVSSLALLRAGLTPSTQVACTPTATVDGRAFENYDDYPASGLGRVTLATAVANSCNTAFISSYDDLDDGDLAAAAASLGLGVDHEVGFPAYFGQVPEPESETEAAADMIGQGRVLASPMTMAAVIGSVAAGETVVPWLVRGEQDEAPADAAPLTGAEARQLTSLLRGVVTDGSGRGLLDVPGAPVIAKTGTAEFDDDGTTRTHAWMVAAQGDLAVAVYVDLGDSGSGTAGPIIEGFLRAAR
ncbi:penicillin-binding transpeptidase domain-containing protein [Nocardioides bruguierae]|uniref:Beta-lactamase n=1 Tax=Nocardioides bruguierae TaxID=2945102 RepID=A0A9X2IDX6_9ACTN|nr:penicillin-binding transpeptidase domain-containing protein [Nocardioides bruguierae]MCM0620226.1 penicillin-binding transpeptidase domain-containing protein [Nocardioides bruguierae]